MRVSVLVSLGQNTVVNCGDIKDFASIGIFLHLSAFLHVVPDVFFFSCLCLPHIGVHC